MALRLSEWVTCGELANTRKNSVCGWLRLCGVDRPISLQLTGNCSPDLAGRHIRFEVRPWPDEESSEPCESEREQLERMNLVGLAWQQVGPTGVMTAKRKVRAPDCPLSEWLARSKAGGQPPLRWKPCLFLEWFSQNGRGVVELVDPAIEFVGSDPDPGSGEENADVEPTDGHDAQDGNESGLSVTSIQLHDDGEVEIRDETPFLDETGGCPEDCDNAYGLIDHELQRSFDAQTRELDRSLQSDADPETDEVMREIMLMDDLIERDDGEPLGTLFDDVVKLPPPDKLDDRQAEEALQILLARLALHGVAIDICEHYTLAETYRLVVEHLCHEESAYPELRGTQWVQHYSTSDFCTACEAEFEDA